MDSLRDIAVDVLDTINCPCYKWLEPWCRVYSHDSLSIHHQPDHRHFTNSYYCLVFFLLMDRFTFELGSNLTLGPLQSQHPVSSMGGQRMWSSICVQADWVVCWLSRSSPWSSTKRTLLSMVSLYDKHKSKMSSGLREKAPMPDRIRSDGEGVLGDAVHTVSCKSSYESKNNHAS